MIKTRRLALLCILLIASIGSAVMVEASGFFQDYPNTESAEIEISIASVSLLLTAEDRQLVTNIVLMDPQVQSILEAADDYIVEISEVFEIKDVSFELESVGDSIQLIPKDGIAQATITINNDYGDKFGIKIVIVTVDLKSEEIINIDEKPETIRIKEEKETIPISELVQNAVSYDGVIVTISGEVSLLGEVFGSLFLLDETITVFYAHEQATIDISNIKNGDIVTVTGKFTAPDTIYATLIQKD